MPPPFNPFFPFLEDEPRAAFFGGLPENLSFGQQQFASRAFEPFFDQFKGALGRQILAGEAPTLRFTDFFNQQFQGAGSFANRFRRAPQFQTGVGSLSRPARFLFQR